jgi:CheY-like chemotaxis protein
VVDDDAETLEILSFTLSGLGAEVCGAGSVAEALAEFERAAPDMLISDIGMPGEDGFALISRVRERGSRVPAIALTAYAGPEHRARVLASGFDARATKPADLVELVATMLRLVGPQ